MSIPAAASTSPAALDPAGRLARYEAALGDRDPPLALVDLDALWVNSGRMLERAGGKAIRVASKSVRCRALLRAILDSSDGYAGLLCFTLPEALWLASEGYSDLLVAYPTTDRSALRALAEATAADPGGAPIVMLDSVAHLDLIEAAVGDVSAPVRVCIDLDAGYWLAGGRVKIGAKRSPLHSVTAARALAEEIARRRSVRLVALMSYEAHIAGLGDEASSNPVRNAAVQRMQKASMAELRERRAAAVAAVREVAELDIVNAGGTGDLELVALEPAMTEATAGSGFYASTLFDGYSSFSLEPAAMFALPVCRRPDPSTVTVLGGGYPASGAAGKDRLPAPYLPAGLKLDPLEGAGEVQTPLSGAPAASLRVGDRVYFRHAKAGELCERFDSLLLLRGSEVVDEVPTYRGEGRTFL